ncbi:MAG: hypothetical protein ACRDZ4_04740 [Egibacteraceae bacterium]
MTGPPGLGLDGDEGEPGFPGPPGPTGPAGTGSVTITSADIAFTDGDTMRRVTITDAAVTAASKIVCSIRRPDTADDSEDRGYLYIVNVVEVVTGSFDVLVLVLDPYLDTTRIPPSETVKLYYMVG